MEDRIFVEKDGNNDALLASIMNGRNNSDTWANNPFIYLVWMMFANRMWGNNGQCGEGGCCNNPQIAALQDTVNTNHNNDIALAAIQGNNSAIRELAGTLNCDFNTLNSSVCDVRNGIQTVAGQIGYSAERVINAVNLGNCGITTAIKDCCCTTQKEILGLRSDLQLQMCQQTGALQQSISGVNSTLVQGFSSLGYENQKLACDLTNVGNANTQRIIDTLNSHWTEELMLKYQDAKLELSQQAQNAYLISQLKAAA